MIYAALNCENFKLSKICKTVFLPLIKFVNYS
jgi:hypothetical protein